MKSWNVVALVATTLLLTGCTQPNPAYQGDPLLPQECRAGVETMESFEDFERPEKIDMLFVVAELSEMRLFQYELGAALPSFLDRLSEDGFDVRVAVQSADFGRAGSLAPAVDSVSDERFSCGQNSEQVADSSQEDWLTTAMCNVVQGTDGSRRARPFDVLERSIIEEPEVLGEFRRDDAKLIVVVVSNEDDCSGGSLPFEGEGATRDRCYWAQDQDALSDVEEFVEALRETATVAEGVSFVAISGPPTVFEYPQGDVVRPVCRSTPGSSYPSPRLFAAAQSFGDQGLFLSSCVLDFYSHFDQIEHRLIRPATATLCMDEPMAHEPLEVWGTYPEEERDVRFGAGFVFLGPLEGCENGAIQLRRQGAEGLERVEVRYCALR